MTVRTAVRRLLRLSPWLVLGLAGSLTAGVLVEVHNIRGPDWLSLLVAPLVIAIWAAIAVALILGGARQLLASVFLGAFLTSLAFMAGILGIFFPFAAGLGNRRLDSYGGDTFTWDHWLTIALTFSGLGGAVVGAFGGFLSWVFRPSSRTYIKDERRA
jgi:hypothetical protein